MTARPWKLTSYVGGIYGTVARRRAFTSRERAEAAAAELRRLGWTASVWRAAAHKGRVNAS